ncbi:MAG: M61 family metallopeptidase [Anaerolineae bacterium]|uniref:M61 family metallopeptidase n=1 Tax=Candidatus Amarolinea dominans TaxID=3140696 RepID=UPI0031365514|nr:M61 family metallopeptidase [Anaerolineae bacterium]
MQLTYTLAMPTPVTHLFHVTLTVTGLEQPTAEFAMPVWTPGSYLVREYARHVQGFAAADGAGQGRPWRKIAKNRWLVETAGVDRVTLSYQVYAGELSVRTSHLDSTHGYFNGATVFTSLDGGRDLPCDLVITPFPGWRISTPLPAAGEINRYHADNFDHLIDSPTEIGAHQVIEFEALGKPHRIAFYGHGNEDLARLTADTQKIVETAGAIFGGLPYDDYLFIIHATERRRGGLEHRNSSSNGVVRWNFGDDKEYRQQVLALLAHEFFHVWNVKRIVPVGFLAFDYDEENYTKLLWVMEGWTSYFELLILRRAGLWTASAVLEETAQRILRLQQTPGRLLQSAEMSSFDTWIKFYRPDENSQNTGISYYNKGACWACCSTSICAGRAAVSVAWTMSCATAGRTTPWSGCGLPEADFQAVVETVAGASLADFFERFVRGVDELPFDDLLAHAGLELRFGYQDDKPNGAADAPPAPRAGLGLRVEETDGRSLISTVFADGAGAAPTWRLAMSCWRSMACATASSLNRRLDGYHPGDRVTLTLFRRDELRQAEVTLGVRPFNRLQMRPAAAVTEAQQALFSQWLHEPFPAPDFVATGDIEIESEKPKP